jgi:hypothetical protein
MKKKKKDNNNNELLSNRKFDLEFNMENKELISEEN